MVTKLIAARLATAAGIHTVIMSGHQPHKVEEIMHQIQHQPPKADSVSVPPLLFTHFQPKPNPMLDRQWWIAHGLAVRGCLILDEGACKALIKRASLLAVGITRVEGDFHDGEVVQLVVLKSKSATGTERIGKEEEDHERRIEVGRGLVNYTSTEIARIKGCQSQDIVAILGYQDADCVIHRDNLVMTLSEEEFSSILIK